MLWPGTQIYFRWLRPGKWMNYTNQRDTKGLQTACTHIHLNMLHICNCSLSQTRFKSPNKHQTPTHTHTHSHRNPHARTYSHIQFISAPHHRHDLGLPWLRPQWKLKLHNWKGSGQRNPLALLLSVSSSLKQPCYILTGQARPVICSTAPSRRRQLINTAINQFTANTNDDWKSLAVCIGKLSPHQRIADSLLCQLLFQILCIVK